MTTSRLPTSGQPPEFLKLRRSEETLVVSLPRPSPVASWAILNGGLRTHVSHIINHHVDPLGTAADPAKTLRQAASKAGIAGTVVGMMTGVDVRQFFLANSVHSELKVCAIATAGCGNLATVGETGAYLERDLPKIRPGTINLILVVNYGFTHAAMLEAIAIATEAKVRAMYEFGLRSVSTGEPATGTGTDCIAVAAGHDRRYTFCGKHTKWGDLVGRASLESIRGALRATLPSETPGLSVATHNLRSRKELFCK
jgi:adenosylcobinamide amidohydrolase